MEVWKSSYTPHDELMEILKGQRVWVGVDLSKCIDLTAVGFSFRLGDGDYACIAHGFLPEDTIADHTKKDRVPYREWSKKGWLTVTPGGVTDDGCIAKYIYDTVDKYGWRVQEICFDPWNARQLAGIMDERRYTCVEVRQGTKTLSEPTKKFRDYILRGKMYHEENRLFDWCLSNCIEFADSNDNIKLTKRTRNNVRRIDLVAAYLNAFSRAYTGEVKPAIFREVVL
jgi:phage terminase large subunit-like protein